MSDSPLLVAEQKHLDSFIAKVVSEFHKKKTDWKGTVSYVFDGTVSFDGKGTHHNCCFDNNEDLELLVGYLKEALNGKNKGTVSLVFDAYFVFGSEKSFLELGHGVKQLRIMVPEFGTTLLGRRSVETLCVFGLGAFTNTKTIELNQCYIDERGGDMRPGKDQTYYYKILYTIIKGMKALENFSMIKCGVNDNMSLYIALACICSKNIKVLKLENNKINDVGASWLALIGNQCPTFRALLLKQNNIGDHGLRHILQEVQNHHHTTGLQHLDVRMNNITKEMVKTLKKWVLKDEFPFFFCGQLLIDPKLKTWDWNKRVNQQLTNNVDCRKALQKFHSLPPKVVHHGCLPEVIADIHKLSVLKDHTYGILRRNVNVLFYGRKKEPSSAKHSMPYASKNTAKRAKTSK
jgi:hypothetical protein